MARKKDRWDELCELVEIDDGFPTRESGPWAKTKLAFWNRYIDITTSAMVDNPKWVEGVVYVDLFAGPGICHVKGTGERFPGSPLIAAHAPKPFRKILLCENTPALACACESRLKQVVPNSRFNVFGGDCRGDIHEIVKQIPSRALTLAFVDPTGLDVEFETLSVLADSGRVDLCVLVADAVDFVRNVESTYIPDSNSKVDRFFGPNSNWREQWNALGNADGPTARRFLTKVFCKQLEKHLGYKGFCEKTITGPQGPLYRLVYASKHERGLEFWNKVTRKDDKGRQTMF